MNKMLVFCAIVIFATVFARAIIDYARWRYRLYRLRRTQKYVMRVLEEAERKHKGVNDV